MKRLFPFIAFVFASYCLPTLTKAAEAAALIVNARGDIDPKIATFDEAEVGAEIRLGAKAELIIIHYAACVESHIKGGTVEVKALTLATTGEIVSETQIECPRKLEFAESTTDAATVVLRGGEARTVIGPRPVFVLLEEGVEAVEIALSGATLASLPVADQLARWPEEVAPLAAGANYEIGIVAGDVRRAAPASVAIGAGITVIQP